MKKVSFYETGNPIPHGRALGAYVLDFLTLTIISLLFFLGVDAIGVQLPKSVTYINYDAEVRNDLFSLMLESHLDEKNADGSQKGSSAITSAFLYKVALASLENNHVSDISTNTYSGFSAITPSTDNAYSYFVSFKKENKGSFMADDKDFAVISDEETYRQALVKACDGNDYFEATGYPYLTKDSGIALDAYLRDSSYAPGKTVATALTAGYSNLLATGTTEFTTYYGPYVSKNAAHIQYSAVIFQMKHEELAIAFILGVLAVYVLAPVILKDGKTVTDKILSIGYCSRNGFAPSFWQILLRALITGIESLSAIPVMALTYYGTQALGFFNSSLIPGISITVLGFSSVLLLLFSYILTLLLRETHQSISEFLSFLLPKDGRVFVERHDLGDREGKTYGTPRH
jgi:hypothetical protein